MYYQCAASRQRRHADFSLEVFFFLRPFPDSFPGIGRSYQLFFLPMYIWKSCNTSETASDELL